VHQIGPEISVEGWTEEPADIRDPSYWGTLSAMIRAGFDPVLAAGKRLKDQAEKSRKRSVKKRSSPFPKTQRKVPTEIIERTPHLRLEKTAQKVYKVPVYADTEPPDVGSETQPAKVRVPRKFKGIQLEVWLHHSVHFKIIGRDNARISIRKDEGRAAQLHFGLSSVIGAIVLRYFSQQCFVTKIDLAVGC